MAEIELQWRPRKPIAIMAGLLLLAILVGYLGYQTSPADRYGELVLLNPRLWQRYQFLHATAKQMSALETLDTTLLTGDVATIAQAGEQAQHLAEQAAVTAGPSECAPVREAVVNAAQTYENTATVFLNAQLNPQIDPRPALNLAREALTEAQNQWQALIP